MGRKRSTATAEAIKAGSRRKKFFKDRLFKDKYCPWCNMADSVQSKIVKRQEGGEAWIEDPLHKGRYIRIQVGHLHCVSCHRHFTAGLLPGEHLVDLYCYWHDEQISLIWYEIGLPALFEHWMPIDQQYYEHDVLIRETTAKYAAGMMFIFDTEWEDPRMKLFKKKQRRAKGRSEQSKAVQEWAQKEQEKGKKVYAEVPVA